MLRCAASFVVAAYDKYASLLADLRALPANFFLQSRLKIDFLRGHQCRNNCIDGNGGYLILGIKKGFKAVSSMYGITGRMLDHM
jgi:hypothetical protein